MRIRFSCSFGKDKPLVNFEKNLGSGYLNFFFQVWHLVFFLTLKGGLASVMSFSNLQIFKKKLFQITILNSRFKFPANNSKQQIQISSSGW